MSDTPLLLDQTGKPLSIRDLVSLKIATGIMSFGRIEAINYETSEILVKLSMSKDSFIVRSCDVAFAESGDVLYPVPGPDFDWTIEDPLKATIVGRLKPIDFKKDDLIKLWTSDQGAGCIYGLPQKFGHYDRERLVLFLFFNGRELVGLNQVANVIVRYMLSEDSMDETFDIYN